jgi:hypothetical protein
MREQGRMGKVWNNALVSGGGNWTIHGQGLKMMSTRSFWEKLSLLLKETQQKMIHFFGLILACEFARIVTAILQLFLGSR